MKKIVFITGANRGLGAAIATEFAALDYKVVISGRNFAACQKKAAEIGSGVVAVQCDITNKESVAKARDFVAGKYKKIDVLVNNAGIILPIEKFCDADPEEWENLINTNITGQMRITHAFYSLLKKAAHARIINISSGSASQNFSMGSIIPALLTSTSIFLYFPATKSLALATLSLLVISHCTATTPLPISAAFFWQAAKFLPEITTL